MSFLYYLFINFFEGVVKQEILPKVCDNFMSDAQHDFGLFNCNTEVFSKSENVDNFC